MRDLRGPCDCPACQTGDDWLPLLATLMVSEARASVALSHDPDCQTLTVEDAGNDE